MKRSCNLFLIFKYLITFKNSYIIIGISVHVHVTPYQVQDSSRPWNREEENRFSTTLKNMGVPIKRELHFADKPRSLLLHFNVIKAVGNCTQ